MSSLYSTSPLFTQEQKELESILRRFFLEQVDSQYVRSRMASEIASDPTLWEKLGELGIIELFSGEGCGMLELSILATEAGRVILPEYLSDRILAGPFLYSKFTEYFKKAGLKNFSNPESIVGVILEAKGDFRVNFQKKVNISGKLSFAPSPATLFLINLTEPNSKDSNSKWYYVNAPTSFKRLSREVLLDRTLQVAELEFNSESLVPLESEISNWFNDAVFVTRAAELSGLVQFVVNLTSEYLKTRKQFGVPIGGFQALQHRMADMYSQSEALRSLTTFSAWAFDNSTSQRSLSARSAIIYACQVAPRIVESAIQLHGGIGFTWEHDLHLYLRRVRSIEASLKDLLYCDSALEDLKKAVI